MIGHQTRKTEVTTIYIKILAWKPSFARELNLIKKDQESQNVADSKDPDPKHWLYRYVDNMRESWIGRYMKEQKWRVKFKYVWWGNLSGWDWI